MPEEHYFVSPEVREYFAKHKKALLRQYKRWEKSYKDWRAKNPDQARLLDDAIEKKVPADLSDSIPAFPSDAKIATRKAGSEVLQPLAKAMPFLNSGSADLHGSTLNYIEGAGDFTRDNHSGRNIHYGIREHGMCSIMNGIAYHGIFRASGATFLVFADYCRAPIRLAALSRLPNIYIFTHDSIGVGEDGPTHEPVETVSGLRVIPQLDVIRPADPEETAGAFIAATQRTDGPTLLALTRQAVPMLNEIEVKTRREGVARGGYIAKRESGKLDLILMSCGSELQHAMKAAGELGDGTRVVSMPCFERFERQSAEYREEVLPASCRRRVAIEAGRASPLVSVCRSRWKGRWPEPLWHERARRQGDERTRHRRGARRGSSEESRLASFGERNMSHDPGTDSFDADAKEFLLEEYRSLSTTLLTNEQVGETRVNWLIGIVTAVIGGLVAMVTAEKRDVSDKTIPLIVIGFLLGLLIFGFITLCRILNATPLPTA